MSARAGNEGTGMVTVAAAEVDDIRRHFEAEARAFDANIVRLIPSYLDMLDALVSALPFERDAAPRVLDLGCGTGTVSHLVLERYPASRVTCLDIAENMLAMAKSKLSEYDSAEYVCADFSSWEPSCRYDAVVSSLALHHLRDDGSKRAFFRKIYGMLSPGGAFLNADVVLSGDRLLQALYLRKWREFMLASVRADEVDGIWFPSYEREDRPAVLVDQLAWLVDSGFSSVDVIWKYYNFAVYGGKKA